MCPIIPTTLMSLFYQNSSQRKTSLDLFISGKCQKNELKGFGAYKCHHKVEFS